VIEEEIFINLTKSVITKDRKNIIRQIHDLAERGMDLRFFYNEYLKFFRDLLVLKSLDESERLHNLNPENVPSLKDMLKDVREVELLRYFNAAKDLEMAIKNTENPRIILEYLFLKLSYFSSLYSIDELIEKAKSGELPVFTVPQGPSSPAPSINDIPMEAFMGNQDEPVSTPGQPAVRPDFASNLIETVRKDNMRLSANIASSQVTLKDNILYIKCSTKIAHDNASSQVDYLKDVVSKLANRKMDVEISFDNSAVSEEEARIKELEKDPKITSLADRLKGRINSVKKIE